MRNKKAILWLFILPFLVPLSFGVVRMWQSNQTVHEQAGGYKSDLAGEKQSLLILSHSLEKNPRHGTIYINYSVNLTPKSLWVYVLKYNRVDETLEKIAYNPQRSSFETPSKIDFWSPVKERDIHRVAAPLRSLKKSSEVVAHSSGAISDLKQYGAQLR